MIFLINFARVAIAQKAERGRSIPTSLVLSIISPCTNRSIYPNQGLLPCCRGRKGYFRNTIRRLSGRDRCILNNKL